MKLSKRKTALILCAAAILLIPQLRSAILPFVLALFLAGCLQKPMANLERYHIPRWLSSLFILLILLTPTVLLLGYGILQVGLSLQSHDPSQRSNGILTIAGGIVITFTKEILTLITG